MDPKNCVVRLARKEIQKFAREEMERLPGRTKNSIDTEKIIKEMGKLRVRDCIPQGRDKSSNNYPDSSNHCNAPEET